MKKVILLALALMTLAGAAQAQSRRDIRNASSIVRIELGDDRDDREMLKRIVRLERAVRELQEKVYDLEATPVRVEGAICSAKFFKAGYIEATAAGMVQARAEVLRQCEKLDGGIFCDSKEIKCNNL
jgi:hypothetical protein